MAHLVIPTFGRPNRQLTKALFPEAIQVVRREEKALYDDYAWVLPSYVNGIAHTRDWILRRAYPEVVIMMDDDLNFAVRRDDDPTKFVPASPGDLNLLIEELSMLCNEHTPHVSMSSRQGANRNTARYIYNSRCMRVHAFNSKLLCDKNIWGFHPEAPFMRDFYLTLALLTRGHSNLVINHIVDDHPGSNVVPGGCTEQRTLALLRQSAEVLQSEFPDFVTIVKKQTKTSWGGEERYDVRVRWKDAAAFGASAKAVLLDGRTGTNTAVEGSGAA